MRVLKIRMPPIVIVSIEARKMGLPESPFRLPASNIRMRPAQRSAPMLPSPAPASGSSGAIPVIQMIDDMIRIRVNVIRASHPIRAMVPLDMLLSRA